MSSSAKKHIWPAYVDMMTVLLMVYVLINAILAVIMSTLNETKPGEIPQENTITDNRADYIPLNKEFFILKDDSLYYASDSLTLHFTEDEFHTDEEDLVKLYDYIAEYSDKKGKWLVAVYMSRNEDVSVGSQLREQSVIYWNILKYMSVNGVMTGENVENRNIAPDDKYENVIKIKFIKESEGDQ